MLQSLQSLPHRTAVLHDRISFGVLGVLIAEFVSPLVDVVLKLKGKKDFLPLDMNERNDLPKEEGSSRRTYHPSVLRTVVWASLFMVVDMNASSELLGKSANDRFVGHPNARAKAETLVSRVGVLGLPMLDQDATFTIEQTGNVFKAQHFHSSQDASDMLANSVDTRCPARRGAEGQYRTKQAAMQPGVRNEHVPTPEGKMCSELGRNVERSAEMTDRESVAISSNIRPPLTDCNSNYVHFYVDSQMRFKWSEARSWPNQLTEIRLVALRLALVWKARMFHAVLDGITA